MRLRPRSGFAVVAATLLLSAALPVLAADPFVFPTVNQGALARLYALPSPAAADAATGTRLQLDWANENVIQQLGNESLRVDGESLRLAISQRWQWRSWRFSAELPLLSTGGGMLDSGIEEWHHWFGLPNGGRDQIPRDEYRYRYVRNGVTVMDVSDAGTGLGDLRLGAARCNETQGCLRVMAQLPTGDADKLTGGGLGAAAWYEQGFHLGSSARWSGAIAGGLSATRADGPMEDQVKPVVPFGWLSLAYALTERLDAGAQFYLHGPLYDDSNIEALERAGGVLAFGFRYRSSERTYWYAGLQEDVITNSSPDFAIHFAVDWP